MRIGYTLLALGTALAWDTCNIPSMGFTLVDKGAGNSMSYSIAPMGAYMYTGGHTTNNLTIVNSQDLSLHHRLDNDAFIDTPIIQFNSAGTISRVWFIKGDYNSTHAGRSGMLIMDISASTANTITVAGYFRGTITAGSTVLENDSPSNKHDGFVAKLDTTVGAPGNVDDPAAFVWARNLHSDDEIKVHASASDSAGNVYVGGYWCVPCNDPATCVEILNRGERTFRYEPTCVGFVTKLAAANGDMLWQKEWPSIGQIEDIQISSDDKIYAVGGFTGSNVAFGGTVPNMDSASSGASKSPIILELSAANGMPVMGISFGAGNVADSDLNADGSVLYVTGSLSGAAATATVGKDGAATTHAISTLAAPMRRSNGFLMQINTATGVPNWAVDIPSTRGVSATTTVAGAIVMGMSSDSADYAVGTGATALTLRSRGSTDGFVARVDAAGNPVWAMDAGGEGMDYPWGVTTDAADNAYFSGLTTSSHLTFGATTVTGAPHDGPRGGMYMYLTMVTAATSTPACLAGCTLPADVNDGKCFIDSYCYDNGATSPYFREGCIKCDSTASQVEWQSPDTSAHCWIDNHCWAPDEGKPIPASGYGAPPPPPSTCQTCQLDPSHQASPLPKCTADLTSNCHNPLNAWSQVHMTDLDDSGACVAMETYVPSATPAAYTTALGAAAEVKAIAGAISGSDFSAAKTAYESSSLKTLATKSWAGSAIWDQAVAHFGSATWLDAYITSALDGTGQFAATLPVSRGNMVSARTEAVKKCLQDQILVMAVLATVQSGATTAANWDLAYAYYMGNYDASGGGAPYERANKRAGNYAGTQAADGVTAKVNFRVMAILKAGLAAAVAGDAAAAAAKYAELQSNVLLIYYQAALRYTFKVDTDLRAGTASAEHQGEGQAFWRVIEPFMAAHDADLSAFVTSTYHMTTEPVAGYGRYCATKWLLENNLPAEVFASQMGTLEGTEILTCVGGIEMDADSSLPAALSDAASSSGLVAAFQGDAGLDVASGDKFAAAKTQYVGTHLETLAKKSWAGVAIWDQAVAHFGSATWMDAYMLTALDATGQFAGSLSPASRGDMAAARTEAASKCAQDQILVNAALSTLETATTALGWMEFYAYYTGTSPSKAPWGRANKRCKNYGTCTTTATTGVAKANTHVLLETIHAIAEITAGSGTPNARRDAAKSWVHLTYFQASLRYAFKIDNDMAATPVAASADHQGEGGAFWRVIAAVVHAADAAKALIVTNFYHMDNAPSGTDHYCTALDLLSSNLPAGLTAADMGTLEDTGSVNCAAVSTPPDSSDSSDDEDEPVAAAAADPCFPSDATVTLESGATLALDELQAGDKIRASDASGALYFDEVSRFSYADYDAEATFVALTTAKSTLRLTAEHRVPVGDACCSNLKKAKDVAVGETLWLAGAKNAASAAVVTKVGSAGAAGVHNPLMKHGGFPVVDGVVTSFESTAVVKFASLTVPLAEAVCEATGTCAIVHEVIALANGLGPRPFIGGTVGGGGLGLVVGSGLAVAALAAGARRASKTASL